MKIRLLAKWLYLDDSIDYIVHCDDNNIYIGYSNFSTKNLVLDTKTMKITIREYSRLIKMYQEMLQELIDNGKILEVLDGDDSTEGMVKFYSVEGGKLVESYGEPIIKNDIIKGYKKFKITHNGRLMYDYIYFESAIEALIDGIKNTQVLIDSIEKDIESLDIKRSELWIKMKSLIVNINKLEKKYESMLGE